ncbi:MAG: tetratricopeptide repeat protein [Sinobacteraceae bacterium]|nr:tetratricopeptide repeat protein [Nevskiaceae bacterium]
MNNRPLNDGPASEGQAAAERLLTQAAEQERNGAWAASAATLQQVLSQWPALADTWYNLARMQRRCGEPEAALTSYARALELGLDGPEEAHLNRGVIYADDLQRAELAEIELRRALQLNPKYLPAWMNLANLHEDRGEREAAREAYARVLALQADHPDALARLANASVITHAEEPLIPRLRRALAATGTQWGPRAELGFALGRALDAAGEYSEAWRAYRTANTASRMSALAAGERYDRDAYSRYIDALIAAFPQTSAAQAPMKPAAPTKTGDAPRLVFICGMFRSGSTLLEQILAAHPQVRRAGELPLLPTIVQQHFQPYPAACQGLDATRAQAAAEAYLHGIQRIHSGADYVTDKRPDNFQHIGLIKALFPRARIVHTRRNALDNLLSIWFLHLDHSMAYATDLDDIAHHLREYQRLMQHWRSLYAHELIEVDYESLVKEPENSVRRLLDALGLPWEPACLEFHRQKTLVKTASVWQVREPLHHRSAGRWQHYASELEPWRQRLADPPV